jgi:DNA polymerase
MAKKAKVSKKQQFLFPLEALYPFEELDSARTGALKCTKCALSETRDKVVFGSGNAHSPDILFVGEGPGADEDKKGVPFVGRAGQLFDRMIRAIGYTRDDVYVTNVVRCRPPNNRKPFTQEVAACMEYLLKEVRCTNPLVIVALGAVAANTLLGKDTGVKGLRGKWHFFDQTPLRATYHPAYLLRTPEDKSESLEDLKAIAAKVGELKAKRR